MNVTQHQKGFTMIEALLILVIVGLIGGTGWYVLNAKRNTDKTLDTSAQKAPVRKKKAANLSAQKTGAFSDKFGHFSVDYPTTWKLATEPTTEYASKATLTSPEGTVLNLYANMGGKGGECQPADGDVPFRAGNACPTTENVSSEKLPVHNVYYAKQQTAHDALGTITFTYEPADVMLVTSHYADQDGKASYSIGVTQSTPDEPVTTRQPYMGLVSSYQWIVDYNKAGTFRPYIYAYANGDSEAFLSSKDATTIKAILRTLKIDN